MLSLLFNKIPSLFRIFWICLVWACCDVRVCCKASVCKSASCCKRKVRFSSISVVSKRRKSCAACSDASCSSSRTSSLVLIRLSSISSNSTLNDFHSDFENRLTPVGTTVRSEGSGDQVCHIHLSLVLPLKL